VAAPAYFGLRFGRESTFGAVPKLRTQGSCSGCLALRHVAHHAEKQLDWQLRQELAPRDLDVGLPATLAAQCKELQRAALVVPHLAHLELAIHLEFVDAARRPDDLDR